MYKENIIRNDWPIIYYSNFLGIAGAMAFIPIPKRLILNSPNDHHKVSSGSQFILKFMISLQNLFSSNEIKLRVWLVQYKDRYVRVQAKKGDKQIAKPVEQQIKEG